MSGFQWKGQPWDHTETEHVASKMNLDKLSTYSEGVVIKDCFEVDLDASGSNERQVLSGRVWTTLRLNIASCFIHLKGGGGVFQMEKVSRWTTENVTILKKRLKTLRQKVSEAKDDNARFALEEVLHFWLKVLRLIWEGSCNFMSAQGFHAE